MEPTALIPALIQTAIAAAAGASHSLSAAMDVLIRQAAPIAVTAVWHGSIGADSARRSRGSP